MTLSSNSMTGSNKRIYQTSAGEGIYLVAVVAILCGKDLALIICGGDRFHIGAAALAVPRPSLKDPQKISASASVLTITSHKEDELARRVALSFSSELNCAVTATVGIHIDNASENDVSILTSNCFEALNTLRGELQAGKEL